MKENILVIAVILFLVVIFYTFRRLNQLQLTSGKRLLYIYITIIAPPIGFLLVMSERKKSA